MTKAPAKQPAFPLMVGDILKDPRLSQASLFSRGVWTILLLYMWEWDQRGEIETTIRGLDRLLKPDSIEEILFFLNELADLEFGSIFPTDENKKLTFPLTLENCNMKVTIRNRKMHSDYKDRQNTRLRVQKHREKKKETEMKRKRNKNVTGTLSSSLSISSSKESTGVDFFKDKIHPYFQEIEKSCIMISKFKDTKNFNPFQFVNKSINKNSGHPGAIAHTLQQMCIYWEKIDSPWRYSAKIMGKENGNFWEREHISDHEQLKEEFSQFINQSPELKALVSGIGEQFSIKQPVIKK